MDDIKLFSKNEKELETLIQVIGIYRRDIRTDFGGGKCAIQIKKSRKRHITEEEQSERSGKRKLSNTSEY